MTTQMTSKKMTKKETIINYLKKRPKTGWTIKDLVFVTGFNKNTVRRIVTHDLYPIYQMKFVKETMRAQNLRIQAGNAHYVSYKGNPLWQQANAA